MKVLIVGASGLVGSNIYNHLKSISKFNVIGTYNEFKVDKLVQLDTVKPIERWSLEILNSEFDSIIFCGGLTNVELCEKDENLSYKRNVISFKNIFEFSKIKKSKFVYISTDYVFDGKNGPYLEEHPKNPISIYGEHKSLAEDILTNDKGDSLIVRITNVYGQERQKKNFINQLINNPKKIFDLPNWQYATPILANDIARALELLIVDNKSGIYNLSSTDFLSRVDIVNIYNQIAKMKINYRIVGENNNNQIAKRPKFGGLINYKFKSEYPNFQFKSLTAYLNEILN
jgi:dTDP-4-dehydrorhamnose reductase